MSDINFLDKLLTGDEVSWRPLETIAKKISSGGTPKTGVAEYYDGDIPWLRTQEVDFGDIWDTGVKITEAGLKNSSAKWIPANCVLCNRSVQCRLYRVTCDGKRAARPPFCG